MLLGKRAATLTQKAAAVVTAKAEMASSSPTSSQPQRLMLLTGTRNGGRRFHAGGLFAATRTTTTTPTRITRGRKTATMARAAKMTAGVGPSHHHDEHGHGHGHGHWHWHWHQRDDHFHSLSGGDGDGRGRGRGVNLFGHQARWMSQANILGQNPMAPSAPSSTGSVGGRVPTAQDVTTAGGVWAPTSAKRDKLVELRASLEEGKRSLDDAASVDERFDLNLVDGLAAIAKAADAHGNANANATSVSTTTSDLSPDLQQWMDERSQGLPVQLTQERWNTFLRALTQKVDALLQQQQQNGPPPLQQVREFMEPPLDATNDDLASILLFTENENNNLNKNDNRNGTLHDKALEAFGTCLVRHRLELVQAAATHLIDSWDQLTTVSDADIDRAATEKTNHQDGNASGLPTSNKADVLSKEALLSVLRAFAYGNSTDRVDAMWSLMDRDRDGLLDEVEMNRVCELCVDPVEAAALTLLEGAMTAAPVRGKPPQLQPTPAPMPTPPTPPQGWRARREERRVKNQLRRLLRNVARNHFLVEIEMPHRLRCIYAWAEKLHQDNRIAAVLIDAGFGGRKRYVELQPKISLAEFREVQKEHFPHLDRPGAELFKSFREDLLIDQGRGRERRELRNNCAAFFTAVCIVDAIIYFL